MRGVTQTRPAAVAVDSEPWTLSRLVLSEAAVGVKVAGKIAPVQSLLLQPVTRVLDTLWLQYS